MASNREPQARNRLIGEKLGRQGCIMRSSSVNPVAATVKNGSERRPPPRQQPKTKWRSPVLPEDRQV